MSSVCVVRKKEADAKGKGFQGLRPCRKSDLEDELHFPARQGSLMRESGPKGVTAMSGLCPQATSVLTLAVEAGWADG